MALNSRNRPGLTRGAGNPFPWGMFGNLNPRAMKRTPEPAGLEEPRSYAEILRLRPARLGEIPAEWKVLVGPEQFLAKLLDYWNLSKEQGAILMGYGTAGVARLLRITDGLSKLESRDEIDRILEFYTIRKILTGLFRNGDAENAWLRQTSESLNGNSPMDLLLEGSWFNLLRVRQFLETIAGL